MTLAQKLFEISKDMPEDAIAEIIDFAEYIKQKKFNEQKTIVDKFVLKYNEALKELAK